MSWVERVLEEWGAWARAKGDGQGWGGSLDLDRLCELARGARDPGVHSDPVQAECAATAHDGQGRHQTVDRYVRMCAPLIAVTARLRYVGTVEPVEDEPERRDRMRWGVSRGTLEGCGHFTDMTLAGPMWFRETAGLPVTRIAELMGVGKSTVYERLETLHAQIKAELVQAAKDRKKRADAITRRLAA